MSREKTEITGERTAGQASPAGEGPRRQADLPELAGRDYQELWFSLSRRPWRSVVLVPAAAGLSAGEAAAALASVGRRLGFTQVSAVVAEQIEFTTVGQLTAQVAAPGSGEDRTAQVIVAIPPVVLQPLGVAVARAGDAVVLCLAVGQTRLRDVQRTIDLVGRERILGAILLPSTRP